MWSVIPRHSCSDNSKEAANNSTDNQGCDENDDKTDEDLPDYLLTT